MNGKIELIFNNDKSECWIKFFIPPEQIGLEELEQYLNSIGVIFGVNHNMLRSFFDSTSVVNLGRKYLIAEGKKPKHGDDGSINYLLKDGPDLKEDENGVINYYDIGLIKKIVENQKLVEIIEPTEGEPGISVFNEEIAGLKGKRYPIVNILGSGVKVDGNYLIAKTDGCYKKSFRGKIDIIEVLEIFENLSYNIGSVDIPSTIIIHGDILPHFQCRSKNDIEVRGVVENASVESGENLICRSGFAQGESPIEAGKDIRVKYISNRGYVKCKNLYVKENVYSSKIDVSSYMEAKKISGGNIWVKNELIAKEIGNEQFQETIIRAGLGDADAREVKILEEDIYMIDGEIATLEEEKRELGNNIAKLERDRNNPWKKDDKIYKTRIYNKIKEEEKKIEDRDSRIIELQKKKEVSEKMLLPYSQFLKLNRSKVIITGKLYPNVKIIFNGSEEYIVKNPLNNVVFKIDKYGELKPFNNDNKVVLKSFRF
jgi:uncharacterized protein (DUF342 family)